MESLLAKLSEQQALIAKQKSALVPATDTANQAREDSSTSPSLLTPATDSFSHSSPDTDGDGTVRLDKAEMARLKKELDAALIKPWNRPLLKGVLESIRSWVLIAHLTHYKVKYLAMTLVLKALRRCFRSTLAPIFGLILPDQLSELGCSQSRRGISLVLVHGVRAGVAMFCLL